MTIIRGMGIIGLVAGGLLATLSACGEDGDRRGGGEAEPGEVDGGEGEGEVGGDPGGEGEEGEGEGEQVAGDGEGEGEEGEGEEGGEGEGEESGEGEGEGGESGEGEGEGEGEAGEGEGEGDGGCQIEAVSDLDGARIEVTADDCEFTLAQAAAGIEVAWRVVIDRDVVGVLPRPQDAGGCGQPGPSGLIVFERLTGDAGGYCLCDTGLCMGPGDDTITLRPGEHPGTFEWDGRQWAGPSDTGNRKGDPLPAGDYTLEVSAVGSTRVGVDGPETPFRLAATARIRLIE